MEQKGTLITEKDNKRKNENIKSNFSIPEEEQQAKLFDTFHFHTSAKKQNEIFLNLKEKFEKKNIILQRLYFFL